MKVKLISQTTPASVFSFETNIRTLEDLCAYCARVSNPNNQQNTETSRKLINYLIKNKHWSPLEMVSACIEIETTRDIARQILRHRSFSFQEFSQRYQNVSLLGEMFEEIELRKQCKENRQSSTEVYEGSDAPVKMLLLEIKRMYESLLQDGVARETARMILPMCTKTKIYMTGPVRSWIHFFRLRDDSHAQKEIQLVAKAGKKIFKETFPLVARALNY